MSFGAALIATVVVAEAVTETVDWAAVAVTVAVLVWVGAVIVMIEVVYVAVVTLGMGKIGTVTKHVEIVTVDVFVVVPVTVSSVVGTGETTLVPYDVWQKSNVLVVVAH